MNIKISIKYNFIYSLKYLNSNQFKDLYSAQFAPRNASEALTQQRWSEFNFLMKKKMFNINIFKFES